MSSTTRLRVVIVSALAAIAAGATDGVSARQTPLASERPAGLTVDFVAVQADGTPVADLQPSEVEVRLDGRVRRARAIRRAATAPVAAGATMPLPAPYGTNGHVAVGRSFVLLVDEESFIAGREPALRSAVEGLLAELTPADRTMVLALPFGGVKVPFTSERSRPACASCSSTTSSASP